MDDLTKITFAGSTFVNRDEEGVKGKIKGFLEIPLVKALGGDLAAVDEEAIVNEIMKGCGSALPLGVSSQCGNLRMLLDGLANKWLEKTTKRDTMPATMTTASIAALPIAPASVTTATPIETPVLPKPIQPLPPTPGTVCAGISEELGAAKSDVVQIGFPPLDPLGEYYEQQADLASCGRRALNNLLGGRVFDASLAIYDSNTTYDLSGITQVQYPIDLHKLCKTLYPDIKGARITDSNISGYCRRIEYHDINLLNAGLEMAGYIPQTQPIRDLKRTGPSDIKATLAYAQLICEPANTSLIGFIINYNKNHWIALKKIDDNQFKILNSSNVSDNKIIPKDGLRNYILEPRVQQIIKVLKPAGVTYIDPRARLRKLFVDPATVTEEQRSQAARETYKADTQALLREMEAKYAGTPEWKYYRAMAGILSFAIHNTVDDAQNLQFRHFLELPTFPATVFSDTPVANGLRAELTGAYAAQKNVAQRMLNSLEMAFGNASAPASMGESSGKKEGEKQVLPATKGRLLFRIKIPLSILEKKGAGASSRR